jgi:hypothetical protein
MPRPTIAAALTLAMLALALPAAAQSPEPDTAAEHRPTREADSTRLAAEAPRLVGHRVRGSFAYGGRFIGTVRSVQGDTLVLTREIEPGVPFRVAMGSLTVLEASRPSPHLARNVEIGGVLGAAGAALVWLNHCDKHPVDCRSDTTSYRGGQDCEEEADDGFALGRLVVLGGAFIGGAIGYALTPVRWRRIGLRVRASVIPANDGTTRASIGADIPLALVRE